MFGTENVSDIRFLDLARKICLFKEQLIDLGKEVGLSTEYVRQAIAEERTRVNVEDGMPAADWSSAAARAASAAPLT